MNAHSELWRDRLQLPAYRVGEAASYARISPQTVASWQKPGRKSVAGTRVRGDGLSYFQLIEVAVVAAMRKTGVKLQAIRSARDYFKRKLGLEYPFVQARFFSDGVNILIEDTEDLPDTDKLIAADINGQLIWSKFIYKRLEEFNYGSEGWVTSWRLNGLDSDIVIDPRVAFGKPNILGISTAILRSRWAAGETVEDIADDFDISTSKVADALRFEGILMN